MKIDGMKIIGTMIRHSEPYDAEERFDYNGIPVGLGVCPANLLTTLKEFAEKFIPAFEFAIQPETTEEVFFEWLSPINTIVVNVLTKESVIWSYVKLPEEAHVSTVAFGRTNPLNPAIGDIEGMVWTRDFSLQFLSPPAQPAEEQTLTK